ncbi:hypothetical protein COOONC_13563 [Cooperia oncophora]
MHGVSQEKTDKHQRTSCFRRSSLFAVHPIHCEAVAGVVGRADVLVAIAVLAGILLYYKTQSAAVAAICTVVAVCFKETGIMLPPLLVVFLLLKPSKVSRPS